MKKRPKLKSNKDIEKFANGGKLMAALPGMLTAGAGIASQFVAPGNPMGIGMIASGAGQAIGGVNQYNQEQQVLTQNQSPQYYQAPYEMPKSYKEGGIHIAPSKRGTFTAAATKHGKSVQGFASQVLAHKENYSPAMVKKANFARNAAKWHHANGGIQDPNNPNAQLESFEGQGENILMPNGGYAQVSDSTGTHSQQEGQMSPKGDVNLEGGSKIFTARFGPDGKKGKSWAELNKKNDTRRDEKVINNVKSSGLASNTAKLNMMIKSRLSDQMHQAQESQKANMYQASINRAAKKYGVNPQVFMNGGQYGVPKYEDGGYSTPQGTFNSQGVKISGPYGQPLGDSSFSINGVDQTLEDIPVAQSSANRFGNPDNMFKSQPQTMPGYDPNRFANKPIIGKPFNITSGSEQISVNPQKSPQTSEYASQGYKPGAMDYIGAGAQLGADAIRMAKSLKKPQTYQPSLYKPESYDPSQALREADQINRLMREKAKVYSGGNASSYLAGMAGLQAGQVSNKASIRSQYDQMNVGARNQAGQFNAPFLTQRAKDYQEDWSVRDNAIADSANKMASSVANIGRDYNRGNMDKYSLDLISKAYPDYTYNDRTRKWEHNITKKPL